MKGKHNGHEKKVRKEEEKPERERERWNDKNN